MSDFNIKMTTAVLKSVSLNKEVHGDENKKALDLSFKFKVPAKQVASLFMEDESLVKILWDKEGNPLLGSWQLAYRFKLEGIRLKVDQFVFDNVDIKKGMKATPIIGRSFEMEMKCRVRPGSKKCADRLWDFRNEDIRISAVQVQQSMELPPSNGDDKVVPITGKGSVASKKAAKKKASKASKASRRAADKATDKSLH